MPNSLINLTLFLIIPFLYSCQKPLHAQESHLENKVAYTQVAQTRHIRKQQRKINERLQKIKERMEKRKQRKRKGGK
jgi:predicted Holliday junction resolvase-like endonuclease